MENTTWYQLGSYGRNTTKEKLLWQQYDAKKDTVFLITEHVIMRKAWDTGGEYGLNRWADCTLRYWLNSNEFAGQVDFGLHPAPTSDLIGEAYDNEAGFLTNFTPQELDMFDNTLITTPEPKILGNKKYKTEDQVFLITHTEYKKLADNIKKGIPSALYLKDFNVSDGGLHQYWARTPNYGDNGVYILDHWSNAPQAMNSGGKSLWGVRPCIQLKKGNFKGKGSKEDPFRV